MVISSLNTSDSSSTDAVYNIPLCEEITLQLGSIGNGVATYLEKGSLISAIIDTAMYQADQKKYSAQQLHFLGDNAFTVNIPRKISLPLNGDACVMFWVGWLQRQLQAVKYAGSKTKFNYTKKFFGPIFEGNANGFNKESKMYKVYEGKIKQKREAGDLSSTNKEITDVDIMQASFLANQHAGDLTTVDGFKHFITRKWIISKSFGMAVLSPCKASSLNYVFVWTRDVSSKSADSSQERITNFTPHNFSPGDGGSDGKSAATIMEIKNKGPKREDAVGIKNLPGPENIIYPFTNDVKKRPESAGSSRPGSARQSQASTENGGDGGDGLDIEDLESRYRPDSRFGSKLYSSTLPPELELELELL